MENSHPIQRFANILYNIYYKTYYDRKIAEFHYESTLKLLQLSNDIDDKYVTNSSVSEISSVECNCKHSQHTTTMGRTKEIENQFVQDIEMAINKAKILRTNDKKTVSPYLTQNVRPQRTIPQITSRSNSTNPSITAVTLNNSSRNRPLNKFTNNQNTNKISANISKLNQLSLNGSSKNLFTMKTKTLSSTSSLKCESIEHSVNCPKNKNSKHSNAKSDLTSKSRVSLGYPLSLESIRVSPEVQRALKLYYKFANEKDSSPISRRSKMRNLFVQKLNEVNSRNWNFCQKENFKVMFELNVYINTYESQEENIPSTSLCKFYDNEGLLLGFQESINKYEKLMIFKEILTFANNEVIDFVLSSGCSETLIPLLYKCLMGIVNVYNHGKFHNIAVIRTLENV